MKLKRANWDSFSKSNTSRNPYIHTTDELAGEID